MDSASELPSAVLTHRSLNLLRGLARKREARERCELCASDLYSDHQHLFEPVHRKVICACDACSVLFSKQGETKFKRVPRRPRALLDFHLTDAQWDSLMIPINMAFFFESTPEKRVVALYPSPAGPIESLLALDAWNEIANDNPPLAAMEPDVEALLVNRIAQSRGAGAAEYFIAPIDECYKLVGLIRTSWRGFSGGSEVWREIAKFFAALKEKACPT
jgi:hypothetical protein